MLHSYIQLWRVLEEQVQTVLKADNRKIKLPGNSLSDLFLGWWKSDLFGNSLEWWPSTIGDKEVTAWVTWWISIHDRDTGEAVELLQNFAADKEICCFFNEDDLESALGNLLKQILFGIESRGLGGSNLSLFKIIPYTHIYIYTYISYNLSLWQVWPYRGR